MHKRKVGVVFCVRRGKKNPKNQKKTKKNQKKTKDQKVSQSIGLRREDCPVFCITRRWLFLFLIFLKTTSGLACSSARAPCSEVDGFPWWPGIVLDPAQFPEDAEGGGKLLVVILSFIRPRCKFIHVFVGVKAQLGFTGDSLMQSIHHWWSNL